MQIFGSVPLRRRVADTDLAGLDAVLPEQHCEASGVNRPSFEVSPWTLLYLYQGLNKAFRRHCLIRTEDLAEVGEQADAEAG